MKTDIFLLSISFDWVRKSKLGSFSTHSFDKIFLVYTIYTDSEKISYFRVVDRTITIQKKVAFSLEV